MTTSTPIIAVLSMLHEDAASNSATRAFRREPVLKWTLRRVTQSASLARVVILCWDDELPDVQPIADAAEATVLSQGPRRSLPHLDAIAAARRWADGWRGGPMGTSAFDNGFDAPSVLQAMKSQDAGAVVLIDPAAALVDPELIDAVVEQWQNNSDREWTFTPAATGLGCMLLAASVLQRLASVSGLHPGRMLHYFPDQVSREPLADSRCAETPTPVARSLHRFTVTSQRQSDRLELAMVDLNGQLIGSAAETIVAKMNAQAGAIDPLPKEVVLELTTRRQSKPIYSPLQAGPIDRPDLPLELATKLIDELAAADDSRLTLAGVGDPLLHANLTDIVRHAADRGISVNIDTDLLCDEAAVLSLAELPADVVSIHLPAVAANTYAGIMGVDGFTRAMRNVQVLAARRSALNRGTPLIVPMMAKCRQNQHEMEAWYDQWLRAVGTAVIFSPSTFGGLIADAAPADMSPPRRIPCRRLNHRLTVLSDGQHTTCELDVCGKQAVSRSSTDGLSEVWQEKLGKLRNLHANSRWNELSVCARCTEWHRP